MLALAASCFSVPAFAAAGAAPVTTPAPGPAATTAPAVPETLAPAGVATTPATLDPVGSVAIAPACAVPDRLLAFDAGLDEAIRRARADHVLTVLAIGSSSTSGTGASSVARSYPSQLKHELGKRLPSLDIDVVNRGIAGEKVAKTVERLHAEVELLQPDLVIWQVGTNDALHGVPLDSVQALVSTTLDWLKQKGVDAMLMDPQLYPKIPDTDRYAAFVSAIETIGSAHNVPVIRRFAAMQHWAKLPETVRKPMLWKDNLHLNDQGYTCVAQMIAEGLSRRLTVAGL
ncbi:SGNH/GDSL hydrolase family protein [Methylobrevis albus]|uniref:SGNH/GDSL hydrolase family protein n=1 Tax=Methylobrevis albus TaxID=2793297 RepID=A0A931I1K1_9HYPH|nr:SGNH/GDSL hydrolase family protein [Methylobrevis albus]MBH0237253.1 SGNH/GDSL hydrolase family protein [Methylobrevis albus]